MTVLSDTALMQRPRIVTPFDARSVQPCSIDLHLGQRLLRLPWLPYGQVLDPEKNQVGIWQPVPLRADGRWMLGARELYLGSTLEAVTVPDDMVGMLHGISSLGRLGLAIHVTAGLVDPGWMEAPLTLEIVSLGGPILLRPGMRIAQITLQKLDEPAARPYAGRYRNDDDVQPSRSYLDGHPS